MMLKMEKPLVVRLTPIMLFSILTIVGLVFSVYLILQIHTILMYLLGICFFVLALISGFFNIFTAYAYYRSMEYSKYLRRLKKSVKPLVHFPSVAVAMPVFNEDVAVVKHNMQRLLDLDYPENKKRYYILDDSTDAPTRAELSAFAKQRGISYIHRDDRKGFKAGALNNLLGVSKEEYLAIFDYDEYLTDKNYLRDILPYFEDNKVAYVQTEKKFANGTFFSDTVDIFHAFFFRFIQPSKALNNTAIFAGSCGIIRKSYLKEIGGFPEYITEDTFFSFESDANGYRSLYIPKVYALGRPITTFTAFAKQQWRYNSGHTQFLGYFFKRLYGKDEKKVRQNLSVVDYVAHGFGLNYISLILLLFTIVSIAIVFSQLDFTHYYTLKQLLSGSDPYFSFEVLGVIAFIISFMTPVVITKIYFKSFSKGAMMVLLNFALCFVRTKAALMAIFNLKGKNSWSFKTLTKARTGIKFALANSVVESVFAAILVGLGIFALMINNLYGGIWLLWYGGLYVSTVFMFYKYT